MGIYDEVMSGTAIGLASVEVVGAVLLFTPIAPLGAIYLIGSGALAITQVVTD